MKQAIMIILLFKLVSCNLKKKIIDYDHLVSILEKGDEAGIQEILWQPKQGQVDYLPIATTLLQKLKKPDTSDKGLSIFKKIEKGNYVLLIFNLPWKEDNLPYSPLILDKTTGKVVGVMLPFNELHDYISKKDNSIIGELGAQWVMFSIEYRSGNNPL